MKIKLLVVSLLCSYSALAASVTGARVSGNTLEVDVRYGGGCKEHKFKLEKSGYCLESSPVQCSANVVDLTTGDFCEALISETVTFDLNKEGYGDSYFSGARLTLLGDDSSSAVVNLPESDSSSDSEREFSKSATVTGASYANGTITVSAKHGGGCEEHFYKIQLNACAETFPVQCQADFLHDNNGDRCEALLHPSVSFTLKSLGLDDSYYSGATIKINGAAGSSAVVKLP